MPTLALCACESAGVATTKSGANVPGSGNIISRSSENFLPINSNSDNLRFTCTAMRACVLACESTHSATTFLATGNVKPALFSDSLFHTST